jgi:hypothetical protein
MAGVRFQLSTETCVKVRAAAGRTAEQLTGVQLFRSERCLMSTRPGQRFSGASSFASTSAVRFAARFRLRLPPR